MPDAAGDTSTPATDTSLGKALSAGIGEAATAARQNRELVQGLAAGLPEQLQSIRSREKTAIAGLGPVPQLTEEEMRHYMGKPPETHHTTAAEEWGSAAMLFAVFGSMFTRAPMTNALNAAAGVLKGFQQRDVDAAAQSYKEWKEANDTALKLHSIQSKAYDEALKTIRETAGDERKDAIATLHALASSFNDKVLTDALGMGRFDLAEQALADREKWGDRIKAGSARAAKEYELTENIQTAQANLEAAQKGGDQGAIDKAQAELDAANKAAADYRTAAEAVTGKGGDKPAQAKQNEEITEARDALTTLNNGDPAEYAGQTITPEDITAAANPIAAKFMLDPGKLKAIEKMRKLAGTPIVHGTKAEPVPPLGIPKKAPAAEGGLSEKDKGLLADAKRVIDAGADRDKVRARYIEHGGKAEDFDEQVPVKIAAPTEGSGF